MSHQDCKVVVGYENSSLHTFRMAKQHGMVRILDAASLHHNVQDKMMSPLESPRAHSRIVSNKNAEIELADWILTTSDLARDSYIDASSSPDRVITIPMGVDLTYFQPRPASEFIERGEQPFRFVFVGRFETLKGSEYLNSVMRRFQCEKNRAILTIVGDVTDRTVLELANVTHIGRQSHSELGKTLAQHDVLVLPSRFDSFGMVVVEAMAVGLPVIVSQGVGSKMLVESNRNGWVMQNDSEQSLYELMRYAVDHQEQVHAMRSFAVDTARNYQWNTYTTRVTEFFQKLEGLPS